MYDAYDSLLLFIDLFVFLTPLFTLCVVTFSVFRIHVTLKHDLRMSRRQPTKLHEVSRVQEKPTPTIPSTQSVSQPVQK